MRGFSRISCCKLMLSYTTTCTSEVPILNKNSVALGYFVKWRSQGEIIAGGGGGVGVLCNKVFKHR